MEFQDELDNNKIAVSFGSLWTSYFTGYEKLSHVGNYVPLCLTSFEALAIRLQGHPQVPTCAPLLTLILGD